MSTAKLLAAASAAIAGNAVTAAMSGDDLVKVLTKALGAPRGPGRGTPSPTNTEWLFQLPDTDITVSAELDTSGSKMALEASLSCSGDKYNGFYQSDKDGAKILAKFAAFISDQVQKEKAEVAGFQSISKKLGV